MRVASEFIDRHRLRIEVGQTSGRSRHGTTQYTLYVGDVAVASLWFVDDTPHEIIARNLMQMWLRRGT